MERAVDMTSATPTLKLYAQDWTYGDHVLQLRSWYGSLSYNDISEEFAAMSQSLRELLKKELMKSFWAWKMMMMINCWKLIVFIF